jgi:hypothetical protein
MVRRNGCPIAALLLATLLFLLVKPIAILSVQHMMVGAAAVFIFSLLIY